LNDAPIYAADDPERTRAQVERLYECAGKAMVASVHPIGDNEAVLQNAISTAEKAAESQINLDYVPWLKHPLSNGDMAMAEAAVEKIALKSSEGSELNNKSDGKVFGAAFTAALAPVAETIGQSFNKSATLPVVSDQRLLDMTGLTRQQIADHAALALKEPEPPLPKNEHEDIARTAYADLFVQKDNFDVLLIPVILLTELRTIPDLSRSANWVSPSTGGVERDGPVLATYGVTIRTENPRHLSAFVICDLSYTAADRYLIQIRWAGPDLVNIGSPVYLPGLRIEANKGTLTVLSPYRNYHKAIAYGDPNAIPRIGQLGSTFDPMMSLASTQAELVQWVSTNPTLHQWTDGEDSRRSFTSSDGGGVLLRAGHGGQAEMIRYLGVSDCLTSCCWSVNGPSEVVPVARDLQRITMIAVDPATTRGAGGWAADILSPTGDVERRIISLSSESGPSTREVTERQSDPNASRDNTYFGLVGKYWNNTDGAEQDQTLAQHILDLEAERLRATDDADLLIIDQELVHLSIIAGDAARLARVVDQLGAIFLAARLPDVFDGVLRAGITRAQSDGRLEAIPVLEKEWLKNLPRLRMNAGEHEAYARDLRVAGATPTMVSAFDASTSH
jgi:hypothetical protein